MSTPSAPSQADVVTALRNAGCVFAEDEARLLVDASNGPGELAAMVERRIEGVPLEQIVGWAEFCGRRVVVEPDVFVPRRRSELLVREAVAVTRPGALVVDLCCGTGAVGAAVAHAVREVELHAVDSEPAAVRCARRNVADVGGRVYEGDLYRPLLRDLRGRVDVIVANAPYVPTDSIALMPPEARVYEPRVALDGGADGLDIQRRVLAEAHDWLAPAGHVLIETGAPQASSTASAFTDNGLTPRIIGSEELNGTVVVGCRR
ncbi:MAG: putative protein N(5)-glutamine methyltransferase [Nocardioidaceae bacterium]